jgi:hypothetical protein
VWYRPKELQQEINVRSHRQEAHGPEYQSAARLGPVPRCRNAHPR